MTLRILRTLGALAAVPLLVAAPLAAHAADDGGRIDHVETDGDSVSVLYSVPGLPSGVTPDPDSVTVTMDGKPVEATAKTVADSGETVRRTAILAIDVSKSMEGDKFAAAQDAARAYVDAAPDDVYIGLVTFASDVTTVEAPTQNHDDLDDAISSLELSPATHLYDGVLKALDETGEEGQRSVLLLSDGIDTTDTELSAVVTQAKNTGARVDVVSLDQKVTEDSPLVEISKATGGTVASTSDSDELEALFTAEATDLAKQLVVTFPAPSSSEQGTLAVSVDADGTSYGDDAFVTLDPAEGTAAGPTLAAPDDGFSLPKPALFIGIGLLFLGMAVLLAFGSTKMVPAEITPMQQQLSLYTVHGMKRSEKSNKSEGSAQLKDSAVAIAQQLVDKRDFETSLNHKLDRAGLRLKAAEWILLHAGSHDRLGPGRLPADAEHLPGPDLPGRRSGAPLVLPLLQGVAADQGVQRSARADPPGHRRCAPGRSVAAPGGRHGRPGGSGADGVGVPPGDHRAAARCRDRGLAGHRRRADGQRRLQVGRDGDPHPARGRRQPRRAAAQRRGDPARA